MRTMLLFMFLVGIFAYGQYPDPDPPFTPYGPSDRPPMKIAEADPERLFRLTAKPYVCYEEVWIDNRDTFQYKCEGVMLEHDVGGALIWMATPPKCLVTVITEREEGDTLVVNHKFYAHKDCWFYFKNRIYF